ncbi:TPA: hypothetical protein DCW54_00320 [Candidatus Dependentiae bacterium]|nr:hypothetical protein [Candidatus Dependentiae bacterium]
MNASLPKNTPLPVKILHTLPKDFHKNTHWGWSPNGQFFAYAVDHIITLFSTSTKKTVPLNSIFDLPCSEKSPIKCFSFTRDSKSLAIVHQNGTLTWYALQPECKELSFQKSALSPYTKSIICSPSREYIATSTELDPDQQIAKISIFQKKGNTYLLSKELDPTKYYGIIQHIEFSKNDAELLICFYDGRVLISQTKDNGKLFYVQDKQIAPMSTEGLTKYKFSSEQRLFATARTANTNTLLYALPKGLGTQQWSIQSKNQEGIKHWGEITGRALTSITCNKTESKIAASNEKGLIYVLDQIGAIQILRHPGFFREAKGGDISRSFRRLWFDDKKNLLYGLTNGREFYCWDLETQQFMLLSNNISWLSAVALYKSGNLYIRGKMGRNLVEFSYNPKAIPPAAFASNQSTCEMPACKSTNKCLTM